MFYLWCVLEKKHRSFPLASEFAQDRLPEISIDGSKAPLSCEKRELTCVHRYTLGTGSQMQMIYMDFTKKSHQTTSKWFDLCISSPNWWKVGPEFATRSGVRHWTDVLATIQPEVGVWSDRVTQMMQCGHKSLPEIRNVFFQMNSIEAKSVSVADLAHKKTTGSLKNQRIKSTGWAAAVPLQGAITNHYVRR